MVWTPPLKTTIKTNEILIIRSKFHTNVLNWSVRCYWHFFKKGFLATQKNQKSEGEAKFEQGLELKYVLRLQPGLKFNNIASLFYVWISLELIKLQGDLLQKWMTGNRPKSSSYPVCFRRRQNGVHQTLIIISSNGRKLSLCLKFDRNATSFGSQI